MKFSRREIFGIAGIGLLSGTPLLAQPASRPTRLVSAARAQIGVTTIYSQAYHGMSYPNGDFPRKSGACTDVIVRAYRDGLDLDLQNSSTSI